MEGEIVMKLNKFASLTFIVAFLIVTLFVSSTDAQASFAILGSNASRDFIEPLADQYELDTGIRPHTGSGGSLAALRDLVNRRVINGLVVDITNSAMSLYEMENHPENPAYSTWIATARANGTPIREIRVAIEPLVFIVHRNNPIRDREFTLEQVRDIFRGTYTNWSQLGGAAQPINIHWAGSHRLRREQLGGAAGDTGIDNKGFKFEKWFLCFDDMTPNRLPPVSASAIFGNVSNDPAGIGYDGLWFAKRDIRSHGEQVRIMTITGPEQADPVRGVEMSRKHPVARYLYMFYLEGDISQEALNFLEYVQQPTAQRIIGGYVLPLLPPARTFEIAIMPTGSPELEQTINFQENLSNSANFEIDMHGETEFVVFARNNTRHDGAFPVLRTTNGTIENRGLFVVHRENDPTRFHGLANNNITELRLHDITRGDVILFAYNGQTVSIAFEPYPVEPCEPDYAPSVPSDSGGCNAGALATTATLLLLPIVFRKKQK